MKKDMKTNPSILVKAEKPLLSIRWSFVIMPKRRAAKRLKGISFHTVPLVTVSGKIIEEIPRIKKTLAILLPKTLPTAMPVFPLMLAIMFTNNSGEEVPKATTVNPITRSDIFSVFAIDDAPSTRKSAPLIRNMNPAISSI